MPGDANRTTRVDSTLKAQAEDVLNELSMTRTGVSTMLVKQIVRERPVPLSLSLDSSNALSVDLLEAQSARVNGYQGRNARAVWKDMRAAIAEAEADG